MITIQKLRTLGRSTRIRKIERIFNQLEEAIKNGKPINNSYLLSLLSLLEETSDLPEWFHTHKLRLSELLTGGEEQTDRKEGIRRELNSLRSGLLQYLGAEPGDWDLYHPETGRFDRDSRSVLPIRLYLEDLRSPFNIGAIFRTAEAFGIEMIFLSETCPPPSHKRAQRTSMGCTDIVSWETVPLEEVAKSDIPIFALELRGTPIDEFSFPREGIALIGSEELGLSPRALSLAERSVGRVSIPQIGSKGSLNVSVACGILLYSWFSFIQK
jgi:TrmH family RNA methyltransferase